MDHWLKYFGSTEGRATSEPAEYTATWPLLQIIFTARREGHFDGAIENSTTGPTVYDWSLNSINDPFVIYIWLIKDWYIIHKIFTAVLSEKHSETIKAFGRKIYKALSFNLGLRS